MFLGCPKKSRVQIHRGTSYSTLLAKTRGLSVGVGLVWVPFPPQIIWEDSWEVPSGLSASFLFEIFTLFTDCSCTWPFRARPEVVFGESASTLLAHDCLTWLITFSRWLASCFSLGELGQAAVRRWDLALRWSSCGSCPHHTCCYTHASQPSEQLLFSSCLHTEKLRPRLQKKCAE